MTETGQREINTDRAAVIRLITLPVHLKREVVPIWEAYGRVSAGDVRAVRDVPDFDRSAFDGYAVRSADTEEATADSPVILSIKGLIKAGDREKHTLTPGCAYRIMTGAPIPEGSDAVAKYEDTEFDSLSVRIFNPVPKEKIMFAGEETQSGDILSEDGKVLESAEIALFAEQGIEAIAVYARPQIGVLCTGDELKALSEPLEYSEIYSGSYYLLRGYLQKYGAEAINCGLVKDETDSLSESISKALENFDMVITTGGISAGDFDLVPKAIEKIGAHILFHKLLFRPGGSILGAVKDGKLILGLSGNPTAATVGLLTVGLPYIKKLCGRKVLFSGRITAIFDGVLNKESPVKRYLCGHSHFEGGRLFFRPVELQRNSTVSSMRDCDLLCEIEAGTSRVEAGTEVSVFFI